MRALLLLGGAGGTEIRLRMDHRGHLGVSLTLRRAVHCCCSVVVLPFFCARAEKEDGRGRGGGSVGSSCHGEWVFRVSNVLYFVAPVCEAMLKPWLASCAVEQDGTPLSLFR